MGDKTPLDISECASVLVVLRVIAYLLPLASLPLEGIKISCYWAGVLDSLVSMC